MRNFGITFAVSLVILGTVAIFAARYVAGAVTDIFNTNEKDLGQILLDTRREYQDLARYKMMLRGELNEIKKNPEATIQDVDDFVTAAQMFLFGTDCIKEFIAQLLERNCKSICQKCFIRIDDHINKKCADRIGTDINNALYNAKKIGI